MKLRDCEGCLVYGTDNKPLSRARVESDKDETIRLYFSNYKLRSVRFQTFVDFYDMQQGLIRCYCELVIRKNVYENRVNEPWMADCEVLEISGVPAAERPSGAGTYFYGIFFGRRSVFYGYDQEYQRGWSLCRNFPGY